MKILKITFIAFLAILSIISCKKDMKEELTIDDFKTEKSLALIVDKVKEFSTISNSETNRVIETSKLLYKEVDILVEEYGKEKAKSFALELMKQARKQEGSTSSFATAGCCSLAPAGNVNATCCNFWENIVVAFETLDCTRPYAGAPNSVITEFYLCVQAEVCENC